MTLKKWLENQKRKPRTRRQTAFEKNITEAVQAIQLRQRNNDAWCLNGLLHSRADAIEIAKILTMSGQPVSVYDCFDWIFLRVPQTHKFYQLVWRPPNLYD